LVQSAERERNPGQSGGVNKHGVNKISVTKIAMCPVLADDAPRQATYKPAVWPACFLNSNGFSRLIFVLSP
jgi:hypothetical protein